MTVLSAAIAKRPLKILIADISGGHGRALANQITLQESARAKDSEPVRVQAILVHYDPAENRWYKDAEGEGAQTLGEFLREERLDAVFFSNPGLAEPHASQAAREADPMMAAIKEAASLPQPPRIVLHEPMLSPATMQGQEQQAFRLNLKHARALAPRVEVTHESSNARIYKDLLATPQLLLQPKETAVVPLKETAAATDVAAVTADGVTVDTISATGAPAAKNWTGGFTPAEGAKERPTVMVVGMTGSVDGRFEYKNDLATLLIRANVKGIPSFDVRELHYESPNDLPQRKVGQWYTVAGNHLETIGERALFNDFATGFNEMKPDIVIFTLPEFGERSIDFKSVAFKADGTVEPGKSDLLAEAILTCASRVPPPSIVIQAGVYDLTAAVDVETQDAPTFKATTLARNRKALEEAVAAMPKSSPEAKAPRIDVISDPSIRKILNMLQDGVSGATATTAMVGAA